MKEITVEEITLPHHHGEKKRMGSLCRELKNIEHFTAVSEIFRQLSDPTRVRIFWLLSHQEECVINIAAMMEMSSPAVSHHLKSLTESGLLVSRRDGKEVYYKEVDFQASSEEIIRNVHNYLVEHISERITIEELARIFLMNTTTLKRVFKKVYGSTIAAHMKEHRMEQAAMLLIKTSDDIASIAQGVGYESQSRFTTAFKETYGELPTEYRKRHLHGGDI